MPGYYKGQKVLGLQAEKVSVPTPGADGKSAYQIAVDNGFEGTETEWLASLKGKDGKSAYQIAVDNGYTGTEEEWASALTSNVPPISASTYTKLSDLSSYLKDTSYLTDGTVNFVAGETTVTFSKGTFLYIYSPEDNADGTKTMKIVSNSGVMLIVTADATGNFTALETVNAFDKTDTPEPSQTTYDLSASQRTDAANQTETTDPIIGRWTDKRPIYRRIISKSIAFDTNIVSVVTIANAELVAPIQGIIDGQNGSEFYTIPGYYPDFTYGVSFVKETGEVKIYGSNTSISDKQLILYIDYVLAGDELLPDDWNSSSTGGTSDHTKLTNRDVSDQHPMSSISGLNAQLNLVPNTKITDEQIHALFS